MVVFEYLGNFFWGVKNQQRQEITPSRQILKSTDVKEFIKSFMSSFDIDVHLEVVLNDAESDYNVELGL